MTETDEVMLFCCGFRFGIIHLSHRNACFSYFKKKNAKKQTGYASIPKYAVTKAMEVLLETTNNNSESQLVWWCCGHDCVVRSQGNPSVPLLPGSTMRPVDGNMVQLQAVLAFWWILPMNLPATISSVQVPVLSHKNVVASEVSNSRLVILKI